MPEPKAGKSSIEKAWDAYTDTLEPVELCSSVLTRVVKTVSSLPPELRPAMHTTYEAAREAFNQALDLEGAAHERYKTAASQADLFAPPEPDAPANGAGAAPSATLPQKTRPRKGNAKPPRRRKPAKGGPEPDGASDQPQS